MSREGASPAIVIGAGIAGAVAAARLRSLGVPVTVLNGRSGATYLHGGGWYLGIKRLSRYVPAAAARLGEALDFVGEGLGELELLDGPFALTDVDGAARTVDLAPSTHAAAATLPEPIAVIDLAPLGHPFARLQPRGVIVPVDYPGWLDAFGRSFAAVAVRMDAAPIERVRLIEALKRGLHGVAHESVLLPPILGLEAARDVRAAVQDALGVPVAEALGTLPSTPGLRLARALDAWLRRMGTVPLARRVTEVDPVTLAVVSAEETLSAAAVILATGGVIPGGLDADGGLSEPLLGLDVSPPQPLDLQRAVYPERPYGGDLFRAGIAVDDRFRPVGPDGIPVNPRLFAVGDVLAGPDTVGDRCSSGLALLSGYLAAEHLRAEVGA